MTLRPEPVSALLVTAVFACVVRFLERGTAAPLAALAVLLPFALTGHHASIAAFAPVLVSAPAILRWARAGIAAASTIVASALALFAVLLFVGSDLQHRRADAALLAEHTAVDWRNEVLRYEAFQLFPFTPPLRRVSVALILLAVLAFVLRRRRERQQLFDLPGWSLGIALLLFVATPSKFPWHFGALVGLAAVAAAAETTRLRREGTAARAWAAWPFVAIGAATLAAAWAWTPLGGWSTADLRTYDWASGASLGTLAVVLPIALLGGALLRARHRQDRLRATPWRVAAWTAPVLAVPMLVLTVAFFTADALKTEGWTLTRQNLGAFRGEVGCGLADDLDVPAPGSSRPVDPGRQRSETTPAWVPPPPVEGLARYALGPAGAASSPWFDLRDGEGFGLYVAGAPEPSDRLGLEWGRRGERGIESYRVDEFPTRLFHEAGAELTWRFFAAGDLPRPPRDAAAMRVVLRSDVAPGTAMAVTAPVTYANEPLARALADPAARPLILPNFVTYFPCAVLPTFAAGVAEVPSHIVVPEGVVSPVREPATSPFAGVLDVYTLERLPVADSARPPRGLLVFAVSRRIPGAVVAPPERTTSVE